MGELDHLRKAVIEAKSDAIAMANVLHYNKLNISSIRRHCSNNSIKVRSL